MPKLPETLDELCDYIVTYANSIYVRDQVNDEWGSFSLAELPSKLAIKHALRFIKEGRVPVRLLTDAEIKENAEATKADAGSTS